MRRLDFLSGGSVRLSKRPRKFIEGANFWRSSLAWWFATLKATEVGLGAGEAATRLKCYGANRLGANGWRPWWLFWIQAVGNPLVMILLVAAFTSAGLGEVLNATLIITIVLVSVALNACQSHRSYVAAETLRLSVATEARVIRDGVCVTLPTAAVVPGDVLELGAGDLVAADAYLLQAKDLFTDQAALTGESLPAAKQVSIEGLAASELDEARNVVFAGSSVLSGTGRALVVHTGVETIWGAIAVRLREVPTPTAFERGMQAFSILILKVVLALVVFVFLILAVLKHPLMESLMFAIALGVGLTPEFLPMILSVTLAAGARRMAARQVIVKHLQAIENFGCMDVLCTDKTGTLTEGTVSLVHWVDVRGVSSDGVLELAGLNSFFETGIRNPLDEAILRVCQRSRDGWRKVDEIPFDFHRRRLSVVVAGKSGCRMIVKGAPEGVFEACCSAMDFEGGDWLEQAEATFRCLSEAGLRVLAVAERWVDEAPPFEPEDERGLVLLGFLAFADQPREGIPEVLEALRQDGIRLVMLTGDNEWVTRRVCEAVGLDASRLMRGTDLDFVRDDALPQVVREVNVFARLSPEQKHRVIEGLRRAGFVVGYLGDGVNDALALRKADVGISVMNAVPVAREAAAIILLQKRLDVLHQGVLEGRRSFVNVMKYLLMNASSNFGNMLSMALAALFLPFLPLLPLQVLLNNLLYDLSQIALASDKVDEWTLKSPRHWDVSAIWHFMWVMGPISSVFDCLTFGVLLWVFAADATLFRTGWFVESLLTQTLVIMVLRTHGIPWRSRPSITLIASIAAACSVACWLPYSGFAPYFAFVALPAHVLATMGALAVLYLITAYRVKRAISTSTLIQT